MWLTIEGRSLQRAIKKLNPDEWRGLRCLQLGRQPLPLYQSVFGGVRRYRQNPFAWKQPTLTEKLWYHGLIDIVEGLPGEPDWVCLPEEVAALLPPIKPHFAEHHPPDDAPLLTDLSILMGMLLRENIRPMWGRWLPLCYL